MRLLLSLVILTALWSSRAVADVPPDVRSFLSQNCAACHEGDAAEAGLDLTALAGSLDQKPTFERWVRVLDRVAAGEMPPADASTVSPKDAERFTADLGGWLRQSAEERIAREGRVQSRKLTAVQLERTLHDLLGIDVPLASLLPEEPRTGGFNTVAAGQSLSHFDLENHLTVVDAALKEAFRRATTEPDEWTREMSPADLSRSNPKRRCRDPELYKGMAVTWSARLVFYGRISSTTAREDGWYRFTFKVSSLKAPEQGVWCTVRTGHCVSSAPLMTEVATFLATEEPQTVTVEAWLRKGQMFEVRPYDDRLKKGSTPGGQVGAGEMQPQDVPGIGFHSATLSRIHHGPDDEGVRDILFGDLKLEFDRQERDSKKSKNARDRRDRKDRKAPKDPRLVSDDPHGDLERLMLRFARRAFRRPVAEDVVRPYIKLAQQRLDGGDSLLTALRDGYRSLLCSPRFLYLHEEPGELDSYALACRLSYFLWSTMPDAELLRLAEQGELQKPDVRRGQVERMLGDERGRRFVKDFAAQWLDLSEIDFTEPDRRLYPNFDLIVQQSMLAETHAFLQAMLDEDLSVSHLIDSDFTSLNERLAAHYRIDGIAGQRLRKVPLGPDDPRGGLLTQGAVLKVTANGTTTSPVIRGAWICERLLGQPVPPPPQSVAAVEPDIRGATTIREQLDLHRSDASCASCHVKIDPPGFALENFDPVGRWRTNYVRRDGRRLDKGPEIDASYELPSGKQFEDVVGFQQIMAGRKELLARNLASQWITYGTGAPITFADREELDRIVQTAADADYGTRSLLHAVIQSRLFRCK